MKLKNVFAVMAMLVIVFMSGCKKNQDTVLPPVVTGPEVNSTNPAKDETGVALNRTIVVTFSEQMDQASITALTFTLKQGSNSIAGGVAYVGTTAIFTPANNLGASLTYTGTITTGAKNVGGDALTGNYSFSFTTSSATDIILPVVSSSDPLNNATDAVLNKVIAVTFSEAMNPSTINNSTFTLKQGTTAVPGTVGYSGNTATFTPSTVLTASLVYTATITTGIKDQAGNALANNSVWSFTTGRSTASLIMVNLGAAINYVILAKTAITNVPTSAITGDMGISPAAASYITGLALVKATGYATAGQVTGKIYAADMAAPTGTNLTTAVSNMLAAYNDAAGRPFPDFSELGTGNIGGKTLTKGLYKWTSSVTMPSDVTISGSATDVWIFQISGTLSMSTGVRIALTGGALAKNIFWQVAGQSTLGATSHFEGILMSKQGIAFQTGASINGRALGQTQVTLDNNTVVQPH